LKILKLATIAFLFVSCFQAQITENKAYHTIKVNNLDKESSRLVGADAGSNEKAVDFKGYGGSFKAGNYLAFKGIDFGNNKTYASILFSISTDMTVQDAIEVRLDNPVTGKLVATIDVSATGNVGDVWAAIFKDFYAGLNTRTITGIHDVYLLFPRDITLDFDFFIFSEYYKDKVGVSDDISKNHPPLQTPPDWAKYYFGDKNPDRFQWWLDARFGMFIHLSPYSSQEGFQKGTVENPLAGAPNLTSGQAEWNMARARYTRDEYMQIVAANFRPWDWDAKAIVKLAQETGQKYIVITTRHHEGFSIYDTKIRYNKDYKITTFTGNPHYYYIDNDPRKGFMEFTLYHNPDKPFTRDILRELSDACKATYDTDRPVYFGTYITIQDWYDPNQHYANDGTGATFRNNNPSSEYNFSDHLARLKGSVRELIEDYGARVLWFDGSGEAVNDWLQDARGIELYEFARTINPEILVNRRWHRNRPRPANPMAAPLEDFNRWVEIDFDTPEQTNIRPALSYHEACVTMGDHWSYSRFDLDPKSPKQLVELLVDGVSKGGNLLMNIGPKGDGTLPQVYLDRLHAIGAWMDVNGESIYNTRKSPLPNPLPGVYTTFNPVKGKLYVHLIDYSGSTLQLPMIDIDINGAVEFANGRNVPVQKTENHIIIDLSAVQRDAINTVIVIN
jgi:alpha-L-fucosidase